LLAPGFPRATKPVRARRVPSRPPVRCVPDATRAGSHHQGRFCDATAARRPDARVAPAGHLAWLREPLRPRRGTPSLALARPKEREMTSILQDAKGQMQASVDIAMRAVLRPNYIPMSPIWKQYKKDIEL
jgi:hypothetical protein